MPIYDYKCECGAEEADKMVKSSTTPVTCTKCGKDMQRQLSAPGAFLLMGEGFYKSHDAPDPSW